jgi:hypothetical protein
MTLNSLIEEIHQQLDKVINPTADVQEWNRKLQAEFLGFPVYNWTDDFNYSKCHTYEILLHKDILSNPGSLAEEQRLIRRLGGRKYSILLKLSVVVPYYLVQLLRRELDTDGQVIEQAVEPETHLHIQMLQRAQQFAEYHGFKRLPRNYLSQLVPDVKLELADPGTVTVYNCLFEDQDNNITPLIF